MDDQQQSGTGAYTPPTGLTPVGAAQPISASNNGAYTAPSGLTPVGPAQPIASASATPFLERVGNQELFHHDPDEGLFTHALKDVGNTVQGFGQGVASTIGGAADLYKKAHPVEEVLGHNPVADKISQVAHAVSGEHMQDSSGAHNLGYGGETLMEFLVGDEAFKGMSLADKLANSSKVMKTIEKFPRLVNALKIGATAGKVAAELTPEEAALVQKYPVLAKLVHAGHVALSAGATQGAQTLVRTGGDTEAAAKDAALAGVTGGVLHGAVEGVSSLATKAGQYFSKGAQSAANIADAAANAPDKLTIVDNLKGQLLNAKKALHDKYEAGIQDLTKRLGGQTVDSQTSPIASKAADLIKKPIPDDHPWTQMTAEDANKGLSSDTIKLLQNFRDGTRPLTAEETAAAKEAAKPSGIVGADGKPIKSASSEIPDSVPVGPVTIADLIKTRQNLRAAADALPIGDVNARVRRQMMYAIDDTIGSLAEKSNDPTALADYKNLRGDYATKISAFNNPVIGNLEAGKLDDAAKSFIATKTASGLPAAGKTAFNARDLQTVLGDKGFNDFKNNIFDGLLKNAEEDGGFNAAKFMTTWNKVADGTKSDVFGVQPKDYANSKVPQNYIDSMLSDAKAAANLQKLTRLGLIAGPGAIATGLAPAVGGIGTVLAFILGHEGAGGIAKGRDILDYVANNPKTWAALRTTGKLLQGEDSGATTKTGKLLNSIPARKIGAAIPTAAVGAEAVNNGFNSQQLVNQIVQQALSGADPTEKQQPQPQP